MREMHPACPLKHPIIRWKVNKTMLEITKKNGDSHIKLPSLNVSNTGFQSPVTYDIRKSQR